MQPRNELFTELCRRAFGQEFETPAAHFLSVDRTSIRHWSSGRRVAPGGAMQRMEELVELKEQPW